MNYIDEFKKNDIPFSWRELKIGRWGYSDKEFYLQSILDDEFVMKYTLDYLSKNEKEENSYVWELGSLFSPYDENEIYRLLNLIAISNEKDLTSYYRWRWILVNNLLQKILDKDYVNALLEVSEFWLDLKSPIDMPYQYQGVENKLTPQEFYTKEHLCKVISDHKKWLEVEKKNLN
ncbi:DUF2247 family protein [Listeria fleischmannii]|jgi:hypothetical protein|uniref:DUF2247 family protein n=1 Tax=Listeria fleischmannii TaxID=1069827 RepID=UPI000254F540|nr:DUF2247 family protein [Listeria fleischmannii]EIA19505.1 hypothetical protein KKC_11993 [Listeria fleischmannii subsp. coloradonensis]STY35864.1 Uncharacterized protein conserved in bacteria (DUF2247) [Listeria fleischmannii subsp. coloradonensis]